MNDHTNFQRFTFPYSIAEETFLLKVSIGNVAFSVKIILMAKCTASVSLSQMPLI